MTKLACRQTDQLHGVVGRATEALLPIGALDGDDRALAWGDERYAGLFGSFCAQEVRLGALGTVAYHAGMDKEALLPGAPDDAHWAGLSAAYKQAAVVDLALAALDQCAAQGRQLDAWESHYFRCALGAIYTNFLNLAWAEVVMALANPDERALGWEARLAHEVPSIDQFHNALEQARHHPTAAH